MFDWQIKEYVLKNILLTDQAIKIEYEKSVKLQHG